MLLAYSQYHLLIRQFEGVIFCYCYVYPIQSSIFTVFRTHRPYIYTLTVVYGYFVLPAVNRDDLCSCNPCPQAGQICYDRTSPFSRECLGQPGPYGSQYTLTFSQDSAGGSTYKVCVCIDLFYNNGHLLNKCSSYAFTLISCVCIHCFSFTLVHVGQSSGFFRFFM